MINDAARTKIKSQEVEFKESVEGFNNSEFFYSNLSFKESSE
jgi:hypothetical protein